MNPATTRKPFRILFVCAGNICRSPAAEIIFRKLTADAGRDAEFEIDSAGTHGFHQGEPPDQRMAATLERNGYTVTGRARRIQPADLAYFDLIVTMDEDNLSSVRDLDPARRYRDKIRPLVSFCREHESPRVPDPYYGGKSDFEKVLDQIEAAMPGLLEHVESELGT